MSYGKSNDGKAAALRAAIEALTGATVQTRVRIPPQWIEARAPGTSGQTYGHYGQSRDVTDPVLFARTIAADSRAFYVADIQARFRWHTTVNWSQNRTEADALHDLLAIVLQDMLPMGMRPSILCDADHLLRVVNDAKTYLAAEALGLKETA
jgi:hypothetical protein